MIDALAITPFSALYAVVMALVCAFAVIRDRALSAVVAVMLVNWVATRAVSALDLPGSVQAAADLICAGALLALAQRPRPHRDMAFLPVSGLFLIMVFFSAAHDAGLINRDTMWAFADVLAYLQLLLIAGAAARGGGGGRVAMDRHGGARSGGVAAAPAQRVPVQADP